MSDWSRLFARVDDFDVAGRRSGAARQALDRWCEEADTALVSELLDVAERRAAELQERTGARVEVLAAAPPADLALGVTRFRALELGLGTTRVYVYTARAEGQCPALHFAVRRLTVTSRHPVIASLPGCLVVRTESGERRLAPLPHPSSAGNEGALTADAVVFRAFELLVAAHQSVRPGAAASTTVPGASAAAP